MAVIQDVDCDGVKARFYRPNTSTELLGLVVFIHGGGWVAGSIDKSDHVCRKLANQSGHAVLSIDYRLSPEHAFPAPLDDCINAVRWAYTYAESELLCDSTRIAVCGDSAGT